MIKAALDITWQGALSTAFKFLASLSLGLSASAAFAQTEPAQNQAGWQICNQTSFVLRTATAFIRDDRTQATGWNDLYPGACMVETPPLNSPRFLYAQSSPIHRGDIREWAGTIELCTAKADFVSDVTDDCLSKGMKTHKYIAVDPNEYTTDLIEPDNYKDKAETAGIQRLLQSAGYKITRVDGVAGQRTARTIRKFKKDNDLNASMSNTDLIAALIAVVQDNSLNVGLTVCNDSTMPIWGAIARRIQDGWQSRGWWDIAPGDCAKPLNASLIAAEAHIFALQENTDDTGTPLPDKHLRTIATTPAQFCIAEAKFSALGREFCIENGYNIANFRPVETDQDGFTIRLTDEDFTIPSTEGLRR